MYNCEKTAETYDVPIYDSLVIIPHKQWLFILAICALVYDIQDVLTHNSVQQANNPFDRDKQASMTQ